MSILLTTYLTGAVLAAGVLLWVTWDLPEDERGDMVGSWSAVAALIAFVLIWPVFLTIWLVDIWTER
jgi:hypothetical protein